MKSTQINPEIKSIIEQHGGSIGAWGPKEIYVEIKDDKLGNDLIEVMKLRGWYLEDEESDKNNLFFHYGRNEKEINNKTPIDEYLKKGFALRKSMNGFSVGSILFALCLLAVSSNQTFCIKWGFSQLLLFITGSVIFTIGGITNYISSRCPICGKFLSDDSLMENRCENCKTSFK